MKRLLSNHLENEFEHNFGDISRFAEFRLVCRKCNFNNKLDDEYSWMVSLEQLPFGDETHFS